MNEERRMILEMLREGTVTVEEAERLLAACASEEAAPAKSPSPKRITILVTENENPIINLRLPFTLVKAGVKISKTVGSAISRYQKERPEEAAAFEALQEMDIDQLLSGIGSGEVKLPYTLVNADDQGKNVHVQITLE